MKYAGFTTFSARQSDGILTVTFDFCPVSVQGRAMRADLNSLAMRLERDIENPRNLNDWVLNVQDLN